MTQMDARIAELVARLTALERERAEIVAEIDTLQSARSWEDHGYQSGPFGNSRRSHRPEFGNRKKDCSVSPAFPRPNARPERAPVSHSEIRNRSR
jgi:hypothetical protein